MEAINPATGATVRTYDPTPAVDVEAAVEAAHEAFLAWREIDVSARAKPMRKAALLLRERAPALAKIMAEEMGKPVKAGRAEAEKCAWVCEYYAEHAGRFLQREVVATEAKSSFVSFDPLGVVLAIMPWNFPLWQVFRFVAPGLMAGNAGLLKHASNVPGSAVAIEEILRDAGFPKGLFRTLLIGSKQVPELLAHRRVAAATLTGSVPAGREVARQAGQHLKKVVLELGGSDAYVVLADASLEAAAEACATSRLINSGQSCIAAKRFIVVPEVRARFEQLFVDKMQRAKMGDPLLEETQVGPMARADLRDELHEQVKLSIARGARLLTGGTVPPGPGAYYPPTVLTDVKPGMPAYDDELFGPVAAIIPARDERDAIRIANDSVFGLGAAIFTGDTARGERLAERAVHAGCVFVNTYVKSDPRLPFGGIKDSGFGRELGLFGIREFVNIKTIWVA